jgi:beta-lactam-binding protein with PASTA domain/tRNA A-37 threonylcarbamoyl transferase component Bud32
MSRIADHVGRVLGGRYRLVAPIGTGASAHVYVADDASLRRRVAVKLLHAALADDETFLRRFRAEAQLVASLRHPNIVSVFDWGEDDDQGPYLVLDYLNGGSLRTMLDRGHLLSPSQALVVGLDAARALEHAHRRGLVHRDIKPANLLFDEDARLSIADFGLARALAEAAWTEPSGAILGTARYAAPEQAEGRPLTGKADVYSLALTLIEAVTGNVPFAADTTVATLMGRVGKQLEVPAALGALAPVLERAGHPDPDERIDSVTLVRELEKAAQHLDRPAPLPVITSSDTIDLTQIDERDFTQLPVMSPLYDQEVDPSDPVPMGEPRGYKRKRRWPKVLLIALLLIGLVAGGAYGVTYLTTPSHEVPSLHNLTLTEARAELEPLNLDLVEADSKFHDVIEKGRIIDQDPSSGELKEGSEVRVTISKGAEPRDVPDLEGMTQAEAEEALEDAGFTPVFAAGHDEEILAGTVIDWDPKDGKQPKNAEISVVISHGKAPREVPLVRGKSFDDAKKAIEALGFTVERVDEFNDDVPESQVVGTRPPVGNKAPFGSKIVIVVSKGPEIVTVPDVTGRTPAQASAALEAAGLRVGSIFGPPNSNRVLATSPSAGSKLKRGSAVDLYVGR